MWKHLFAFLVVGLVGCANLNTVYREVSGSPSAAKSFVVDASQRAIIATKTTDNGTIVCPEPFPDAIAAFFASGSATASLRSVDTSSKDFQAGVATGSSVASFGLRTNSTVLLTNEISANCFAHMNGATKDSGYMELQRRLQTFNLGILAIERITGNTKGDQSTAGTTAGTSTGTSDTSTLQKAVDQAKSDVASAKSAVDDALKVLDQKNAAANNQNSAVVAAQKAMDAAKDDDAKKQAQANLNKEKAALEPLIKDANAAQADFDSKTGLKAKADKGLADAQSNLSRALGVINASGSGTGTNTTSQATGGTISDGVAQAVTKIVTSVLLEAGLGEGCNGIINDFPLHPEKYKDGTGAALLTQCIGARQAKTDALKSALSR